jgi:succinate-semialdehyde dehydrogenase / glutarate-semialdehyde dehydrogenase
MPYTSVNPFTEATVSEHREHDAEQVEAALARAASAAAGPWRTATYAERARTLRRVADLLEARAEEFAVLATTEMGKRVGEARYEVGACVDIIRYFATNADTMLASRSLDAPNGSSTLEAHPLGTIFCIEPWNFPYIQMVRVAAPILMAGNTVVMKHAPTVPGCALAFEALFSEAGAPDGLYVNLFLTNEQAAAVIADERIAAVSLTGSEAAGAAVAAAAGRALKKVTVELGGSDAFVVLDDASLDEVVPRAVFARMLNTGQACGASKRFIVHERLYDGFVAAFARAFEALRPGDPLADETDLGPLTSAAALAKLEQQIERAVAHGARVVTGGGRIDRPGYFLEPTILVDVSPSNPVYREELFGPVAMVFKVADEDEAVALANDSPFGLGGAVFSSDVARAERVGRRLDTGMVYVNQVVDSYPNQPWGGVKRSGFGRELSELGIKEFINWKLIRVAT